MRQLSRKIKIRHIFLLFMLVGFILPFLGVWLVTYRIVQNRVQDEVQQRLSLEARFMAGTAERLQRRAVRQLEKIDALLHLPTPNSPLPADALLEVVRGREPIFESLVLVNPQGIIEHLSPFEEDRQGNDLSGLEIFLLGTKNRGPTWGRVQISINSGNPTLPVSLNSGGKLIIGFLDLSLIFSQFKEFGLLKTGDMVITDPSGTVIVHPDPDWVRQQVNLKDLEPIRQALAGRMGSYAFDVEGRKMLGSVARIPQTGWVVLIQQSRTEAFAFQREIGRILLISLAVLIGLTGLVGFLGLKKVGTITGLFYRKMEIIKTGREEPLPEIRFWSTEVAAIDREFTYMAQAVRERQSALTRARDDWEQTFEAVPEAILLIDPEGRIRRWNAQAEQWLGIPGPDIMGKISWDLIFGLTEAPEWCPSRRTLRDGAIHREERWNPHRLIWLEITTSPWRDEEGRSLGMVYVARDITARRTAEAALQESEAKYRSLIQNAKDAIFIVQDGRIKFPNPSTLRLSGYSEAELHSRPFPEFIHPDDQNLVIANHQRRLQGEAVPDPYEFRILTRDGDPLWVELNAVLNTWEGRPSTLNFLRDITEQKRLEAQLLQAQKMEAVGTLAGGVAHDFNNLLQAIIGNTELLMMDFPDNHPGHGNLARIRQTSLKARDLVQQLLTFSRKIESRRVPVNLNREIEQARSLLSRILPKMIEIHLRLDPDLKSIEADATQVGQVLMNLAINAQDALPEGGTIRIETGNRVLDESDCRMRPGLVPGKYVTLIFSDTGLGMDAETQKRIFEPFFTTKGVGKGTGLGMAMVYGIIKSHQGFIYCRSEPGAGATFEIYFPEGNHRALTPSVEKPNFYQGKGETILLVDDEPWLLDLGGHILDRFGYRSIKAHNGEEALEILEENRDVDLIIMDLLMPGMGGRKCLEQVLRISPESRFIVASGYAQEGSLQGVQDLGAKGVIQKPYSVEDLLKMVRGALDGG